MALIPGRARVFYALSKQMIRSNQIIGIKNAIARRRRTGITTWNGWGCRKQRRLARSRIELGEAVEGLIWIAILGPVSSQGAKVVSERAILLRQENNVIENGDVLGAGRHRM